MGDLAKAANEMMAYSPQRLAIDRFLEEMDDEDREAVLARLHDKTPAKALARLLSEHGYQVTGDSITKWRHRNVTS